MSRLGATRVETMGTGTFDAVSRANDALVLGRVYYIVTYQGNKFNGNEYLTHFVP